MHDPNIYMYTSDLKCFVDNIRPKAYFSVSVRRTSGTKPYIFEHELDTSSAQSDQNLLCALCGKLRTQTYFRRTDKTDGQADLILRSAHINVFPQRVGGGITLGN